MSCDNIYENLVMQVRRKETEKGCIHSETIGYDNDC